MLQREKKRNIDGKINGKKEENENNNQALTRKKRNTKNYKEKRKIDITESEEQISKII